MKLFKTMFILGVLAVVAFAAVDAPAKEYPAKPISIIVGFGPGGVADLTCRVVAQQLSVQLGQQVLVENRPSAGGILAADAVAKSPADGYTLLLLSNGNAVSESLFKTLPYNITADFVPVVTMGSFDLAVITSSNSSIKSVGELIAYAKANPGKLNIGTINVGTTQNLAAELFRAMSGIDATIVPYKNSPDVLVALRSGDIQVSFDMLAPIISQFKSGVVNVVGITSDRRFVNLPDVPTVAESGLAGYNATSWNAISAPAKTPKEIVEKLNKEINTALASEEVKKKLLELGVTPRGGSPEDLKKLLATDIEKWRGVIEKANIPKQ